MPWSVGPRVYLSKQGIENLPDNLRIARHSGNLHDVKNGHVSGMPALSKKSPRVAWVLNISEGRSSQGRETKRPPIRCKRQVTSAPPALRLAFPAASRNCPALRRKDCAAASAGEHCTGDRRPILQRTNHLPWGFPSTCSAQAGQPFRTPEKARVPCLGLLRRI